jgi:uncharacterized protein
MGIVTSSGRSRDSYFPAIEKKYGHPMAHWHGVMKQLEGRKYAEQMAHLMDQHGFTRAHANALVMFSRGSHSARRFDGPEDYFANLDPDAAATMRSVFTYLLDTFTGLDLVIAWNQPMLKHGSRYVFGMSAAKRHLLLAPWGEGILASLADRLDGYTVNKKTIQVPISWDIDTGLLHDMIAPQLDS